MHRSVRIARVVVGVTAGCIAAGAAAGLLCAVGLAIVLDGPPGVFSDANLYPAAALIGGVCGLILGPAAAFGFLRRVPLGRLFAETAIGAGLAGLIGFPMTRDLLIDLLVAGVGFAVAVAQLAWRYRDRSQAINSSAQD